jgi:hypothetical protein
VPARSRGVARAGFRIGRERYRGLPCNEKT